METVGLENYAHRPGECYGRKIASLTGPCGDPRCKAVAAAASELLYVCQEFVAWWIKRFGAISEGGDGTYDAGEPNSSASLFSMARSAIAWALDPTLVERRY